MDIGLQKNKSITILLNELQKEIVKHETKYHHKYDIKIRSLIKEIKKRELSKLQSEKFNKLVQKFAWI